MAILLAPFAPFLFDVIFVAPPLPDSEVATLAAFQALLEENKGTIAAFIFEPLVQGASGMRMYSPAALETMLQCCKQHEVLAIADEVMTGFGRSGKFWATDYIETKPDIYCLSKGLTGGTMALGMTTCTAQIFDAFWSDDKMKTLFHGHSCTGNPLACSVGLASMDLMDKAETWENIAHIITKHEAFKQRLARYSNIENLRQQGVILAFEVVDEGDSSYFNSLRDRIWQFFIERGLLLRPLGNTIYILPPYCITDEELDMVYDGIEAFLNASA
jgi:adenosylmethionine-8-amino-7-oxononanoate aminotransferase